MSVSSNCWPGSEADGAREGELLDGEIVFRLDQLLLPRLQFDAGAQRIDGRRGAGFHLIGGLVVEGLRRLNLGVDGFDQCFIRNGLQVGVAHGEDDEVSRILIRVFGGFDLLLRGAGLVDGAPIEQGLAQVGAGIEIREGTDDRGNIYAGDVKRKSELGEVHLGNVGVGSEVDVRQERAQLLPALAARVGDIRAGEQQAEILLQAAVDRVLQRQRKNSRNELGWDAS